MKRYTILKGDDNGLNDRILTLDHETTNEVWDALDQLSVWKLNNIREGQVVGWELPWGDKKAMNQAKRALKQHGYKRVKQDTLCPNFWTLS